MLARGTAVTTAFTVLVTVYLEIIVKRLLDTFIDKFDRGRVEPYQWFALASVIIVICHAFVVFLRVISEPEYSEILEGTPRRNLVNFVAMTLAVMTLLYLMADWFAREFKYFFGGALALNCSLVAFDGASVGAIGAYFKAIGKRPENVNLFHAIRVWRLCDSIMVVIFSFLGLAWLSGKIKTVDVSATSLMFFMMMSYLIPHILDVPMVSEGSKKNGEEAERFLDAEGERSCGEVVASWNATQAQSSALNHASDVHSQKNNWAGLGVLALLLVAVKFWGIKKRPETKANNDSKSQ